MNIAIVGAGAIGCFLAARLSDAGHDVTLVARPGQAEALNRDGLALRDRHGHVTRYRPRAAVAAPEDAQLVLLAVKTQDVAEACRALAPRLHGAPVVALQNGVQGDHIAAEILGGAAVLGAVVLCAVEYLRAGEVSVQFAGWLVLGETTGPATARTRAVAATLRDALPVYLSADLAGVRWSKLIFNLNNALCAATNLPLAALTQQPLGRLLSVAVMKEGHAVARAAGLRLDHGLYGLTPRALRQDPNAALVALLQGTLSALLVALPERAARGVLGAMGRAQARRAPMYFSTWQSIARGRPSEIEYLNGEIARLGARVGLPTPYNTRLVAAVHAVEATRRFVTLEELLPAHAPEPVFSDAYAGEAPEVVDDGDGAAAAVAGLRASAQGADRRRKGDRDEV